MGDWLEPRRARVPRDFWQGNRVNRGGWFDDCYCRSLPLVGRDRVGGIPRVESNPHT